ncbi:hypothetical protein DFA_01506 [Cavenderia fasciculata]|uniref:Uncharacterized protein n=1 Tax=Cavenderia fasciculata TaxID=261658 RepID=F4PT44_CACFS|nr:uncharacterized protein DFA_01506 [Cavenderia fasciculata]EGG21620.1 hypothetical protein DFA_01506 [Cavenderia fasciculata]|eukprot:XP_004359470.1 hypothetical protein DFA_01506 [Cavenderia fasciculata]
MTTTNFISSLDHPIRLGICAMEDKVKNSIHPFINQLTLLRSTPMKVFIQKIQKFQDIQINIFTSKNIESPIEDWPICDAFLCFYSQGFPIDKAISYCDLRKPYEVNNLKTQKLLTNRKKVYQVLEKHNIPTPKKIFSTCCDHSSEFIEHDDYIECKGERIYKPFVEKPFDAEDHNICIYYPMSQGGGCRKLFRKVGDNSSCFDPNLNSIRRDGSYVYEEFVELDDAKDVKVYSTPAMAYAELRKSPSVDGHVERNNLGREMRTVTLLSDEETSLSLRINNAFNQFVCGFDILRTNGVSYVCDVNGWSMVKGTNQDKFYEESGKLLGQLLQSVFSQATTPDIRITNQPILPTPSLSSSSNTIFSYIGNHAPSKFHTNNLKPFCTKLPSR